MSKTKHTPLPWKVYSAKLRKQSSVKIIEIQDCDGSTVVHWTGFDATDDGKVGSFARRLRIAMSIVECVNSYAANEQRIETLTKALEAAERMFKDAYPPWATSGGPNQCAHGVAEGIACFKCDREQLYAALRKTP